MPCLQLKMIYVYFSIVSLSNATYSLQLHGQEKVSVGMNLTIRCIIMESGKPVENSDIQLSLVLPTGEVIIAKEYSTVATLEHNGTYSCISFVNDALTVVNFTVVVYGKTSELYYHDSR